MLTKLPLAGCDSAGAPAGTSRPTLMHAAEALLAHAAMVNSTLAAVARDNTIAQFLIIIESHTATWIACIDLGNFRRLQAIALRIVAGRSGWYWGEITGNCSVGVSAAFWLVGNAAHGETIMQDPLLLRRTPTLASSLLAYAASSLVAALVVMQAVSAVSFMPGGMEFRLEVLPILPGYVILLAGIIAAIAALPAAMAIWLFRRLGITSWKMFALAGSSIGVAALLVFLKVQGISNRLANWLTIKPSSDDALVDMLVIGSIVTILAGGLAGVTYRLVAGYERAGTKLL